MSDHSQDIPDQQLGRNTLVRSKLLAQIVLCSSACQVVLLLPSLILFCQLGCLILSSSCWFPLMPPPDASARRNTICSSSQSPVPEAHQVHLSSSSFPLFCSYCLSDSVFVHIHSCFARPGSLDDRSDSPLAFVIMWLVKFPCDASAAQPGQPSVCS